MTIHVAPGAIRPVHAEVLREFQREATIAGFRKGKAPVDAVERKYVEEIREELLRRLTRQTFEQVAKEHKLRPVGPFEVSKLQFDPEHGLDLEAQVEVEPEFALAEYKGIQLAKPAVAISEEERAQAIRQLQESMAELAPAGEGQPKEKRVPALDNEFAKDMGFDTLEALAQHVDAKLREQKQHQQRRALEQSLSDELVARHQFDLPPGLVAHQAERLARDFQVRLLLSGMNEEQAKAELDKYTEQMRTNAERHVKLSFILDRIADQEQVTVTQDELVEHLWKLSKRWGKDPSEVRRLLDAKGLWSSVVSSIRQEKSLQFLLDAAQIDETNSALAS